MADPGQALACSPEPAGAGGPLERWVVASRTGHLATSQGLLTMIHWSMARYGHVKHAAAP